MEHKDHELEIVSFCWSPDSSKIATGALDGKIVVRSIDNQKNSQQIKVIDLKSKILGLVWDTFDKYIAVLNQSNVV